MKSKTVLLVGASGGIGNKTTQVLLREGYSVIGTYYQDLENLNNLKKDDHFSAQELNIKDLNSVKSLFQLIKNKELYAVVNCAGICEYEDGDVDKDIRTWNDIIATNLSGNFYLAKVFQQILVENGRFVMISSTDSFYGGAITASYAASKAGVNSLTKSLSLLFSQKKVRVNAIAPGWVLTPMIEDTGQNFLDKVAKINPLKRIAKPEDIAKLIKFLLSDESDYINGQVIAVEGGYTNQDPTLMLEEETQK